MSLATHMKTRPPEVEVWWEAHPERWPHVPQGHYIGPDGGVLSPPEFASYGQGRRIVVIRPADERRPESARLRPPIAPPRLPR